jgi:recombinase
MPQHYVEGNHESIIPKEIYLQVQEELVLQDAVIKAINQMPGDKSSYQVQLQINIASVIRASQATSAEKIDEKPIALQQELIQKAQSNEAYTRLPMTFSGSESSGSRPPT